MKQRIISGIIMLPFLVFLFWGNIPLLLFMMVISGIALWEFYNGYKKTGVKPSLVLGFVAMIALYAIIIWGEFLKGNGDTYAHLILLWVFCVSVSGVCSSVFLKDHNILDGPITSLGIFYIPFMISHVVLVDQIEGYSNMVFMIFITAFATDICAYFTGYLFGKHKLCPSLSPKKTVEGAIGGTLGSIIFSSVFGYFVFPGNLIHFIIMGFVGAIFAQVGDLSASAFKRKMGIKDYSNLIPGHGGALDRFDSVLFTAPFIYYYTIIFLRP